MRVNASSIAVYRSTGTKGWQWSVAGPNGMTFGSAATEEEAWAAARKQRAAEEQAGVALRRARGVG